MTGEYLTDARVQIDSQFNEPYVAIDFDRKGAKLFERVTGENVKKRLAIVLDKGLFRAHHPGKILAAALASPGVSTLRRLTTWPLC
ncbi:MAG: hypothetical protein R2875_05535 [Desulfobacterales bacterium]